MQTRHIDNGFVRHFLLGLQTAHYAQTEAEQTDDFLHNV
jgi:hypothetical protein